MKYNSLWYVVSLKKEKIVHVIKWMSEVMLIITDYFKSKEK